MENIKLEYQDFLRLPFPSDLKGADIKGIELVLLESDTVGIIQKFIVYKGRLDKSDIELLIQCSNDLKLIIQSLNKTERQYFEFLLKITNQVINHLSIKP